MFPDPTISAVITATRLIFTAYSGYQKGKLANSDQALREEVRRRCEAVRGQITPLYSQAHRNKQRNLRNSLQDIMDVCDQFIADARYSISHTPDSSHGAAVKLNKKSLKLLIEHDFDTLDRLVKCEEQIKVIAIDLGSAANEGDLCTLTSTTRVILTESRHHFAQRNMIIDGYVRKGER